MQNRGAQLQVRECKYKDVADDALRLYEEGMVVRDIAKQLGCTHTTITRAVRHALERRGLDVDGAMTRRCRRNSRLEQNQPSTMASATTPEISSIQELCVAASDDGEAPVHAPQVV